MTKDELLRLVLARHEGLTPERMAFAERVVEACLANDAKAAQRERWRQAVHRDVSDLVIELTTSRGEVTAAEVSRVPWARRTW